MKTISLNGRWALSSNAVKKALKAKVPGDVYRDLLDAKVIKDPFYRDNELDCQWIGESDWSFERDFKASAALLKQSEIRLRCHGLDTLATIYINGKKLADTNNMHRIWEWDIKGYLKSGNNQIKILFKSASEYVTRELKKKPLR